MEHALRVGQVVMGAAEACHVFQRVMAAHFEPEVVEFVLQGFTSDDAQAVVL